MSEGAELGAALERVHGWLAQARRVVALTGAGISTDSGIPDFRGPQGEWTRDPLAEKLSSYEHYVADPAVRRAAWQRRLAAALHTRQPNAGHRALVELERAGKLELLVTQNVDRLHQRAGSSPARVVEMHGNALEMICLSCGSLSATQAALVRVQAGEADPPCADCGGVLKSTTVLFGESLAPGNIERALAGAASADVLLAIGSSLAVYPAAAMVPTARRAGARVVIVNAEPTELDALADVRLRGKIGELLPLLARPWAAAPDPT
jgi:NAD-dependent deacetylase